MFKSGICFAADVVYMPKRMPFVIRVMLLIIKAVDFLQFKKFIFLFFLSEYLFLQRYLSTIPDIIGWHFCRHAKKKWVFLKSTEIILVVFDPEKRDYASFFKF